MGAGNRVVGLDAVGQQLLCLAGPIDGWLARVEKGGTAEQHPENGGVLLGIQGLGESAFAVELTPGEACSLLERRLRGFVVFAGPIAQPRAPCFPVGLVDRFVLEQRRQGISRGRRFRNNRPGRDQKRPEQQQEATSPGQPGHDNTSVPV